MTIAFLGHDVAMASATGGATAFTAASPGVVDGSHVVHEADPSAASAFVADFGDSGEDWGWWISKSQRKFGWDNGDAGRNAIFGNLAGPGGWATALCATTLSHMGKHAPVLIVNQNDVPVTVEDYLLHIKP
jgi:hypothetical protein